MGKHSGSGSGLKYLNFFMRIRDEKNSDPGWEKVGSGIGINIPDPQHSVHCSYGRSYSSIFLTIEIMIFWDQAPEV
jgi:hypothetical protein